MVGCGSVGKGVGTSRARSETETEYFLSVVRIDTTDGRVVYIMMNPFDASMTFASVESIAVGNTMCGVATACAMSIHVSEEGGDAARASNMRKAIVVDGWIAAG